MIHLHLSGKDSTQPLLNLLAALTDHARLQFREIRYDKSNGTVVLPIMRFPLIKQRHVLGNVHDDIYPTESQFTIRNVESCEIEDSVAKPAISQVMIQFGLNVKGERIFVTSAEEDQGQTCVMIEIKVSEIDIEILDK